MRSPNPEVRRRGRRRSWKKRGFTLLEVLVAVAILGMSMTVILSSQVGLFSSAQRAQQLSIATSLGRCKMSEVELQLQKEGYPSTDLNEEGVCCEEEEEKDFQCSWKVEKVELPQPASLSSGSDGGADPMSGGGLGPLAALLGGPAGGAELGDTGDAGLAGLATALGAGSTGTQGIASILMGMVYPNLKPMLEASIRKVTVKIQWREGRNQRDLSFIQYVTNPQQGLDPNAEQNLKTLENALPEAE
jgi:general secretion pathway protein I